MRGGRPRLRATWHRLRYPLLALTRRELRKRYASTWLGTLWAVLQPLAMVAIYVLVFGVVLRHGRSEADALGFALYMLAGLLPFQALSDGLQRACSALREDRQMLEREGFPAAVVPLSRVLSAGLPELVGLALVAAAAAATGQGSGPMLLLLPLAMLLRTVLTAGLALLFSMLAVFVADVAEVLGFLLLAALFLTPVFYRAEQLPPVLAWTLHWNPLHALVSVYRGVLLDEGLPLAQLAGAGGWALLAAAVGSWVFARGLERARDLL